MVRSRSVLLRQRHTLCDTYAYIHFFFVQLCIYIG